MFAHTRPLTLARQGESTLLQIVVFQFEPKTMADVTAHFGEQSHDLGRASFRCLGHAQNPDFLLLWVGLQILHMAMAFRVQVVSTIPDPGRATVSAVKGFLFSVKLGSIAAAGGSVTKPPVPPTTIRALSSSRLSAHSSRTLNEEPSTHNLQDAKPWSQVPKTKTTLGLNLELMKNPFRMYEYLQKQAKKLGHMFKLTGVPGLPEMVVVINPKDVEVVYRVGDSGYPQRFPFYEWEEARKELKRSNGMFLE